MLEIEYYGACRARGHRGQATNGLMDAPCPDCEYEMSEMNEVDEKLGLVVPEEPNDG